MAVRDRNTPQGDDWNRLISVQLTVAEAWHLRSAGRSMARRRRNEAERSDFVPEPGKQHAGLRQADVLESGAQKLFDACFKEKASA